MDYNIVSELICEESFNEQEKYPFPNDSDDEYKVVLGDLNLESVDEFWTDDLFSIIDICAHDDFDDIQKNFIVFIKDREFEKYNQSYIEDYFSPYKSSVDEIVKRTRTQLWMENCIYGLHFQAYVCMVKNIPLPVTSKRNRKYPIVRRNCSMRHKGIITDSILEDLFEKCKLNNENFENRQRNAPRNQIGLLIFLLDMLNHPYYRLCIMWENKMSWTFKILNSKLVAYYWMVVKENDTCSFENFTRGIRYLRHNGYFKQIDGKKQRTYQFSRKAIKEYQIKRERNDLSNVLFYNLTESS